MKKGIGSHTCANAGLTDEWATPRKVLDPLGPFDLDPCAMVNRPWDTAAKHYTIENDGLRQPWEGRVYCNPPYGALTGVWLQKLAEHGNGIALTFARTETVMFHQCVWDRADAVFFFLGRLYFCRPDGTPAKGNAGGPSILVAYGAVNAECLSRYPLPGRFVSLKKG